MNKHSDLLNVEEGTIEFRIKKNKLTWNDGLKYDFTNLSNDFGSVLILKDTDDKIKFFHVILGKSRTDVETDVSSLSVSEDHSFAFTWSIETKKIIIYVDGKEVNSSEIKD